MPYIIAHSTSIRNAHTRSGHSPENKNTREGIFIFRCGLPRANFAYAK